MAQVASLSKTSRKHCACAWALQRLSEHSRLSLAPKLQHLQVEHAGAQDLSASVADSQNPPCFEANTQALKPTSHEPLHCSAWVKMHSKGSAPPGDRLKAWICSCLSLLQIRCLLRPSQHFTTHVADRPQPDAEPKPREPDLTQHAMMYYILCCIILGFTMSHHVILRLLQYTILQLYILYHAILCLTLLAKGWGCGAAPVRLTGLRRKTLLARKYKKPHGSRLCF